MLRSIYCIHRISESVDTWTTNSRESKRNVPTTRPACVGRQPGVPGASASMLPRAAQRLHPQRRTRRPPPGGGVGRFEGGSRASSPTSSQKGNDMLKNAGKSWCTKLVTAFVNQGLPRTCPLRMQGPRHASLHTGTPPAQAPKITNSGVERRADFCGLHISSFEKRRPRGAEASVWHLIQQHGQPRGLLLLYQVGVWVGKRSHVL